MQTITTKWMNERIEILAEILADQLIEEIRKRALEKEKLPNQTEAA
ncbi:hypothetical protein [Leptospira interrogans]|nr:hypothetical protein [Leptospira interrogans]EKR80751.1 hypothetical protein LEP1GSC099_1992 [Leptospira interrogans str. UI 08452]EMN37552.1 hypothetical protein LEP1GSC084_3608 [Leptospira interrogans serovar Medanensis str. L0448]EMN37906.1 hypothetical protein LEP1GSC085_2589 [Leptospira interrogans str. L0996]EMN93410.1 hypothetical protein LEP1GSC110_1669 [Leptospira interrogans serovar Medanensis str. UT053]